MVSGRFESRELLVSLTHHRPRHSPGTCAHRADRRKRNYWNPDRLDGAQQPVSSSAGQHRRPVQGISSNIACPKAQTSSPLPLVLDVSQAPVVDIFCSSSSRRHPLDNEHADFPFLYPRRHVQSLCTGDANTGFHFTRVQPRHLRCPGIARSPE